MGIPICSWMAAADALWPELGRSALYSLQAGTGSMVSFSPAADNQELNYVVFFDVLCHGATDVSDPATDLGNPLWKHCLRNSYVPPFSAARIWSNLKKGQSSVPPESVFTASSSLWFGTVSNSEFGTFWCDLPLLPPILGPTWRHGSATIFFQRTSSRCTVLKCEFNGVIFPGGNFCSLTSPTATDATQDTGAIHSEQSPVPEPNSRTCYANVVPEFPCLCPAALARIDWADPRGSIELLLFRLSLA